MRRARESQDLAAAPDPRVYYDSTFTHPRVELIWLAGLIPGVGLSD